MYRQMSIDFRPEEVLTYLRKSQSDDPLMTVEEVLAKHESILDDWSERNLGGKVPESNKFREVVSGETIKGRPEIQKVLSLMESPRFRAVQVVEPQRLSRGDLEDIGRLMKLLKHTGTIVITPTRIYDLHDEYDWDAFERELKRGNEYLEYYKKIQARGRLLSVSQGNYIASIPPYGYDKTVVMDGKRECPTLKINDEQANAVRIIFDLFVNKRYGVVRIANYLDAIGVKPISNKYWSPQTIRSILANKHYIGKVVWNRKKTVTYVEDGEFISKRPRAADGEYLVFDGKHEAIIDDDLFNEAQSLLGSHPRTHKGVEMRNPLSSILWCRSCGHAMIYQSYHHLGRKSQTIPRYVCSNYKHCDCGSTEAAIVFDKVCDILEKCIEDFSIEFEKQESDSSEIHERIIKSLESRMDSIKAKELAQWEAQYDPDPEKRMPQEIFRRLNKKLLAEKEEVRKELEAAYKSIPDPVDYSGKAIMFRDALSALRSPDVKVEDKNLLLKQCISRIEYFRAKPQRGPGRWTSPEVELDVKLNI